MKFSTKINHLFAQLLTLTCLFMYLNGSMANVFDTKVLIQQDKPPSLSIIGEFATEDNLSDYEIQTDIDNDGDNDILKVSSNADSSILSVEVKVNNDGIFTIVANNPIDINLPNQSQIKLMDVYAQDLNGDGLKDLWFNTKLQLLDCHSSIDVSYIFKNLGSDNFEQVNSFYNESYRIENTSKGRTIMQFEDINDDGMLDPKFYNLYFHEQTHQSYQLINEGGFQFSVTGESTIPYISDLKTLDYNYDGKMDFISISETQLPSYNEYCKQARTYMPNIMDAKKAVLWMSDNDNNYKASDSILPIEKASGIWVFDINNDKKEDILLTYRVNDNDFKSVLYFSDEQNTYSNKYEFNEVVSRAEVADLNNDGLLDIVIRTNIPSNDNFFGHAVVYENLGDNVLLRGSELLLNFTEQLILRDMNKDGKIDILGGIVNYAFTNPVIYSNLGNFQFSNAQLIGDGHYRDFTVADVDIDGLPDLVLRPTELFLNEKYILKNNGDNDFQLVMSDLSDVSSGSRNNQLFDFQSYVSEDLDGDGKEDIVVIDKDQINDDETIFRVRVLMHENNHRIEFYNNTDIQIQSLDNRFFNEPLPQFKAADFNNDGLKDIIVNGDGKIYLLTQKENPSIEDIYYDPEHSGHGFSVENVGRDNLYYSIFYSYDVSGNSEWYLQLNKMVSTNDGTKLLSTATGEYQPNNMISYLYDYNSRTTFPNPNRENGLVENSTVIGDDSVNLDFQIDSDMLTEWNGERLINKGAKPPLDFSGLWWAGIDDSGWGLSLNFVQISQTVDVFAVLYFYDGNGTARWIVGQAENFVPNESLTLDMNMINGYGRNQNSVELTEVPAGTITINLKKPSKNLGQSGKMSMNVHYPRGPRKDWVRDNIPFALFSKPKD